VARRGGRGRGEQSRRSLHWRAGRRRRWVWYALALAATGYLNLVALMILVGHIVAVAAHRRPGTTRPYAAAVAAALVLDAPVAWLGARQATRQLGLAPQPHFHDLWTRWPEITGSTLLAGMILFALAVAWAHPRRASTTSVAALTVLPVLLLWTVSFSGISYFSFARYLLFTVPAAVMLVAAALDAAADSTRIVVAGLLIAALAVSYDQRSVHAPLAHFSVSYAGPGVSPEDYKRAAAIIAAGYQPGDAAMFDGQINLTSGIGHYLPRGEHLKDIFVARTAAQRDDLFPTFCSNAALCAANAPARVWIVEPDSRATRIHRCPPRGRPL
jgi:mannosyltransferase